MTCHLRGSQKLLHNERHMSQSTVTMQGPGVVAPLVWTFAPNVFPQSLQNVAKEFSIHRLSWWNKFLMHLPSMSNFCHIFGHGFG
jgi:hypothetical protein